MFIQNTVEKAKNERANEKSGNESSDLMGVLLYHKLAAPSFAQLLCRAAKSRRTLGASRAEYDTRPQKKIVARLED